MNGRGGEIDRLLRRLAGRRAVARSAILFERIWPALWPALGVAGLFVCAALLDLPELLPPGVDSWWVCGSAGCTASRPRMTVPPIGGWSLPPACRTGRSPF